MTKVKKLIRKNFRFTQQISDMLSQAAKDIGKTENELIATAFFEWITNRDNFIIDPSTCRPGWIKAEQPLPEGGLTEFEAKDGSSFWVDNNTYEIIRHVKDKKPG